VREAGQQRGQRHLALETSERGPEAAVRRAEDQQNLVAGPHAAAGEVDISVTTRWVIGLDRPRPA
jgi:hypothetical protein